MNRREIIAGLGSAAAWPVVARTQQSPVPVIGILVSATPLNTDTLTGLRKGLSDEGYEEGKNVAIVVRAVERYDQTPALAADLVRQQVTVIVAVGLPAAIAAKTATATIPIVFFAGDDPVRAGLVTTLGRPSGNLTGVTNLASALFLKRLGLLRELVNSVPPNVFMPATHSSRGARFWQSEANSCTPAGKNLRVIYNSPVTRFRSKDDSVSSRKTFPASYTKVVVERPFAI
jgi:ABC-type uncharacterized transport system substrate-binding protein